MATILVVDDVTLERLNAKQICARAGYTVIEAKNGQEAVAMTRQFKPAAVLMDIVMPLMDGFTATKRLQTDPTTRHIPIIVISSKKQESDIARAKMLGAKGYLVKPVKQDDLLRALRGII